MKKYLLGLFFVLLTTAGYSQSIEVKGRLVDDSAGDALPYATISVANQERPQVAIKKLATDDRGRFSTTLEAGSYLITFQFVGMSNLTEELALDNSKKSVDMGDIKLSEHATELDEVRVTAQRPLVKVEIDKLTYNAKEDPESATSNVLDLLRKVPLVTVDGEDNIQLKGSSSFKIYMNGKPSNLISTNPSQVLKSMPANSIKDVEVITDPGARYDAEGIGGIINIITDKRLDEGYSGSVGANADTFGGLGANAFLTLKYGKVGFTGNGSYFYHDMPTSYSRTTREEFSPNPVNSLTQESESIMNGGGLFYNAMLSYEPDTLNLFNINIGHFGGEFSSENDLHAQSVGARNFKYLSQSSTTNEMGSFNISTDYQRNFKKKGEMLTASYRFERNPNDGEYETLYDDVEGNDFWYANGYRMRSINDASGIEHTGQIDYVNPIGERHNIEVGVKYIFRDNQSRADNRYLDTGTDTWIEDLSRKNDLDHTQHIASGYAGYTLKMGKTGIKVGVRGEHTEQDVRFMTSQQDTVIHSHFFDMVPSMAVSHQLGMTQSLRWGYNMRISRPGIWYLNPYVNDVNPTFISYGNPDLDAEHSHNFNVNYGSFGQKVNLNVALSYSYTNNAISPYIFVNTNEELGELGVTHSTYKNIGKNHRVGLDGFFSWTPTPILRMNFNGGLNYSDIQSTENSQLKNSGFSGRAFGGVTLTLPKDFRLSVNGGLFTSNLNLQTTQSAFYFYSFTAMKSLLKKKLDISLNASSPFQQYRSMTVKTHGEGFQQENKMKNPMRNVRLSLTYRFGDLKSSVKRVQRTITNEDLMQGEGGQGGGMGQGGEM